MPPSDEVDSPGRGKCREATKGARFGRKVDFAKQKTEGENKFRIHFFLFFSPSVSLTLNSVSAVASVGASVLRTEVSTGHPHPRQREPIAYRLVAINFFLQVSDRYAIAMAAGFAGYTRISKTTGKFT